MSRYSRQIALFGTENQEKLAGAHVGVIGAGGLGSPALLYLAGAGVGKVTLVDDDVVDTSNLHRQVIHRDADVGRRKVDSAADAMLALNPEIQVERFHGRLTWGNALEIFEGVDVIMDGADNFGTRHIASTAAARLGVPHVWGSILGFEAQTSVFWAGHGPVYEDLFPAPPPPGTVPSCSQAGVLGPLVGTVGSTMAMETLKLLTGLGSSLLGRIAFYDSLSGQWEYVPLVADPAVTQRLLTQPPAEEDPLPEVTEVTDFPEGAVMIDVREPDEVAQFSIPGAINVPLGQIMDGYVPPEAKEGAVVFCAGGVRSARAIGKLREADVHGLVSLAGGVNAWRERN